MQITTPSFPVDASALSRAESLAASARTDGPQAAAHKFEALFATMLVKEMRKALPEGFFGNGSDGDIYAGWLDQHLGEAIAKRNGLNIAPIVEQSLARKQQESAP